MQQKTSRALRAVVAADDPQVVRRIAAGFDALALSYGIFKANPSELLAGPQGAIYCLGARIAADLPYFRGPTIVVLHGAQLTDKALLRFQGRRLSSLHLDGFTPASLLRAIVSARIGSEPDSLAELLHHLRKFDRVSDALLAAFVRDPAGMTRLADLRRALGPLSRESAQKLVRSTGFTRAEHLFTALRWAAWALLRREGLHRKEVEQYLGIADRTSFRRACRRAGVPPLHEGLCPEESDPQTMGPN